MNAKNIAWLATGLLFCPMLLTQTANAQWDPESGDTGEWTAPPETAETPPAEPEQAQPQQETPPATQPAGWTPPPAQQPAEQPSWFAGQEGGETPTDRPPAMGGPEQGAAAPVAPGTTDHSQVTFGVTFFGLDSLVIQPNGVSSRDTRLSLDMPVVGVRYWLSESLGLDIGFGLGVVGTSDFQGCDSDNCDASTKIDGTRGGFGIRLHVGVPVVLKSFQHFNVLLTPELGFAYGTATVFGPGSIEDANADISLSGLAFDLAVKLGGELQFGFWGVPNLAIQGNIGLGLRYSSQSASNGFDRDLGTGGGALDVSSSGLSVRTIANDLAGSVRILYYF